MLGTSDDSLSARRSKSNTAFQNGGRETRQDFLSKMLLSDLELQGSVGTTLQVGEQRAIRLADLKVNGLEFDLNYDIIIEFTIQTLEELSGSIGAVSLPLNW